MGFFKRLFGGGQSEYVDKTGIYLYARCANCGAVVRVRADKQHDLNQDGSGFTFLPSVLPAAGQPIVIRTVTQEGEQPH